MRDKPGGWSAREPERPTQGPQAASIIGGKRGPEEQLAAVRQMMVDCEAERCRASTKLVLRFIALTAVRPNEVHGARWDELHDLDGKDPRWVIPSGRMKGDEDSKAEEDGDHIVPLSRQCWKQPGRSPGISR
ncbi:hypothetical protein [Novosphingobium sp. Leaf2]|uniref:hypothetical protein n=1 Tax=Novosphingobium sp. Leaf2 TaxID=1735670 RepID=UPI00138F6550|nr:hypothetical protein [Novosphingobium sp. Leaf2]